MPIDSHIVDPKSGRPVKVTLGGAIAVTDLHPSLAFNATLETDDVVVNVVPAKADHVFCMTALLLTGNKNIDQTTAATVSIYTADSESTASASALTTLFSMPVAKNSTRDITGILVESEEAKWINAVTTDDDIFITVLGYYLRTE